MCEVGLIAMATPSSFLRAMSWQILVSFRTCRLRPWSWHILSNTENMNCLGGGDVTQGDTHTGSLSVIMPLSTLLHLIPTTSIEISCLNQFRPFLFGFSDKLDTIIIAPPFLLTYFCVSPFVYMHKIWDVCVYEAVRGVLIDW